MQSQVAGQRNSNPVNQFKAKGWFNAILDDMANSQSPFGKDGDERSSSGIIRIKMEGDVKLKQENYEDLYSAISTEIAQLSGVEVIQVEGDGIADVVATFSVPVIAAIVTVTRTFNQQDKRPVRFVQAVNASASYSYWVTPNRYANDLGFSFIALFCSTSQGLLLPRAARENPSNATITIPAAQAPAGTILTVQAINATDLT